MDEVGEKENSIIGIDTSFLKKKNLCRIKVAWIQD